MKNDLIGTSLEKRVVGIALRNPLVTEVIGVKSKYFQNKNLARIYEAVADNPNIMDIYRFYPILVHKYHYQGSYESVKRLKRSVVVPRSNWFNMYVKDLHRQYLRRCISKYSNQFSRIGDNDSYDQLAKCVKAYGNVDLDNSHSGIAKANANLRKEAKGPRPWGLNTGYTILNKALGKGLQGGTLMTVGAGTNVGKTAFSINIAANIMRNAVKYHHPIRIDYFSEEMTSEAIEKRFISNITSVSDYALDDFYSRAHNKISTILNTGQKLQENGLEIYDGRRSLENIVSTIRRHATQRKPNTYLAIVDHIGIVPFDNVYDDRKPRYLQIAKICSTLHQLAVRLNIPIIEQAQINRSVSGRDSNELSLSDLNESSAIEQDSDLVLLLYRKNKNKAPNVNLLIGKIAKNRLSFTGKIPLFFIGSELKFEDARRISPQEKQRIERLIYEDKERVQQRND